MCILRGETSWQANVMKKPATKPLHLHDGYSPATKLAYMADWKVFETWCRNRGVTPLPASVGNLVEFLREQGSTRKPATLSRRKASISSIHRDHKLEDPTKDRDVRVALKHIFRTQGRRQKQAKAMNFDVVAQIVASCPSSMIGLRDRALVQVAYDLGCRRSELVALLIEDVITMQNGSGTVLIRKAKSDQEGSGQVRYLSTKTMKALQEWLSSAKLEEGPIFRSVKGRGAPRRTMPPRDVSRRFKELARNAGIEWETAKLYSGHSTRVGMAQDMAGAGISLPAIMQAGGWKTPAMVARYTERLDAQKGAAAQLARMQGR